MQVLENLNWRYATKSMNGTPVPQEKVDYILDAIRLSASSSGLQPYEILVITDQEVKEKIKPIAWNQSQITDASHVLVFAAWDNYTPERINGVFKYNNEQRNLPDSVTDDYRNMLLTSYTAKTAEENFTHAAKQAYIALGTALIAAAEQEVDSTPMEGFDPAALDEILDLKSKGLRSVVVLPLGYRNEEGDWLVNMKKVRTPKEKFITVV
ncbi:nitroreductase [Algoriphagus ratkowskyi]|uniref:NAD(P)H-dependent oxidoreductase n=1 Tax=Algoriphagus ratkowskyi TaxID=57028 RepID=A0A2W7QRD0_9BACT|nr:NAD(P)H-dependent oxidoreductase [Algoriphagus ratkowskyi]PZX51103.1 nitroreductase [Algoriphagus ratkowskyi]TXD75891.1 NAD(P)H-dependent oxidoreductase [Algoriphagus ratkowskyi]|tara:strand:- start:39942 stop:40571 length:630 start_codon:yes stop_codon:yes gene_type:complete